MSGAGADYEYVDSQARFAELCSAWCELPAVALDTEFERERTFYAKIGLLQVAAAGRCYLVDPLRISDWEPLRRLLAVTPPIMHAAGEDLQLLHHVLGGVPADLFDTQLAAAFLGVGFSLSYRDLARIFRAVELPKSETRSNWLRRPLSPRQLRYAADDVRFLPPLWEALDAKLRERQVWDWFAEDCRRLSAVVEENEAPENWQRAWRQISDYGSLDGRAQLFLQRLCEWREREIRRRDIPRNWFATDKDLLTLARSLGQSEKIQPEEIRAVAGIRRGFLNRHATPLAKLLNEELRDWESTTSRLAKPGLGPAQWEKLKQCRELARAEAERLGLSPELLGGKKLLRQVVQSHGDRGKIAWPSATRGWRRHVLAPLLARVLPEAEAPAADGTEAVSQT